MQILTENIEINSTIQLLRACRILQSQDSVSSTLTLCRRQYLLFVLRWQARSDQQDHARITQKRSRWRILSEIYHNFDHSFQFFSIQFSILRLIIPLNKRDYIFNRNWQPDYTSNRRPRRSVRFSWLWGERATRNSANVRKPSPFSSYSLKMALKTIE